VADFGAWALYAAENLALDGAVLYVAARAGGERAGARLAVGAAVGCLYACLPGPLQGGVGGRLACAFAMILAAHGRAHPLRLVRRWLVFMACAVLVGGGALGALALLGVGSAAAAHPLPAAGFMAGAGAVMACERLTALWRLGALGGGMVDLEVEIGGARAHLRGLVDTGNRLRDPLGREPVVVAEAAPLAALLPPAARAAYLREAAAGLLPDRLAHLHPAWAGRLRAVPYRAVGAGGVLTAVRPDALWACVDGGRVPVRGLVALAPGPLGHRGADALVPPELLPAHPSRIGA
jgi:sigma-E processing peptidase SpoIIGA